jgi:anti-anti-sigma factor
MTLNTHISFRSSPESSDAPGTYGNQSTPRHVERSLTASKPFSVQRFSGDVDMQSTADFAAALDRVLWRKPECVVLDLTRVDFLSASGLAILAQFCADADEHDIPVAVVGGRQVARPIEACHLDTTFGVYETVDEAGTALTDHQPH